MKPRSDPYQERWRVPVIVLSMLCREMYECRADGLVDILPEIPTSHANLPVYQTLGPIWGIQDDSYITLCGLWLMQQFGIAKIRSDIVLNLPSGYCCFGPDIKEALLRQSNIKPG